MGAVIVKVSDKGFDNEKYSGRRGTLTFQLDDSLQEATIIHGPDVNAETNIGGVVKEIFTVRLNKNQREASVLLAGNTQIKLESIKCTDGQTTLAGSGTKSGTIEVSGNPFP